MTSAAIQMRENPLREGLRLPRTPDPCAVVVFGATGDLTARKLIPAIYNLAHDGLLPTDFFLIGFGRKPIPDAEFQAMAEAAVAAVTT